MEYEAVCRRSEHRMEAGLSERQVEIFLDAIIAMPHPNLGWRSYSREKR
jgi:hypothetical protein